MKPPLHLLNVLTSLTFLTFLTSCQPTTYQRDLSGSWKYRIDSLDEGIAQKWFTESFPMDTLHLPGSLAENGKGFPVGVKTKWTGQVVDQSWYTADKYEKYRKPGNIKIPFWLQPEFYYVGAAWYQREIKIPSSWKGQRIILTLERCHWESSIWIDGEFAGKLNSLATAHRYDLTKLARPGSHLLTIRIDNRMIVNVGENAHSVSDHTQSNWNGIVGKMTVEAIPVVSLGTIKLYPDIGNHIVKIVGGIENSLANTEEISLEVGVKPYGTAGNSFSPVKMQKEIPAGSEAFELFYPMGDDCKFWDEFSPNLYEMKIALTMKKTSDVQVSNILFGMRDFKAQGSRLAINGRPTFLRGTLECAIFPKTGYPALKVEEWQRIYKIIKAHGLNHMRFHSWCPPEAAFIAADIEGIYLYVECGAWTSVGTGNTFDEWLYAESERIVNDYGNHPSFVMMSYGNEPGGSNQVDFLEKFVSYWKNKDKRRVYTSGSGWPTVPSLDFYSTANPRIQGWGSGLNTIINAQAPSTSYDFRDIIAKDFPGKPVVSHEIGQWCVYPDFKEIAQYTGVLKAKNFEIFKETLEANKLGHLADSFLLASGKLQALCYKADIEAALRTPGMAGFELLDLHDFPGQGTALVGVLNPFWEQKGYITPEEYSLFCNPVVPLARMEKLVLNSNEIFKADIEVANYGPGALQEVSGPIRILNSEGQVEREDTWSAASVPTGTNTVVGKIEWPLSGITKASKYTLETSVGNRMNRWDFWVYPLTSATNTAAAISSDSAPAAKSAVPVFTSVTPRLKKLLDEGGSAILSLGPDGVAPDKGGNIALGFSSIFWNTAWTRGQAPHTLGILCNPEHPALKNFPTEYYSTFQWWDILSQAKPLILDGINPAPQPIVRIIDDWFTNRSLGLVIEAKVGKGKLIITGADLLRNLDKRPAARQLLMSLRQYAASLAFQPVAGLTVEEVLGYQKK
ncbi:MAG: beta-galactosidase [Bacteroidia bacterium]|nr:beta-galactosidase [Bacteroidia bacterium]